MDFFTLFIVAVVCLIVGAWGYHTMLKRNPVKLAAMLAAIKEAGKKAEDKFGS
jgi:drug/metabolite transporter superfamily protein YnfA